MKSLVTFIMTFGLGMSAIAAEAPKSFVEDVIEAMAKEYLKSAVRDVAIKNAELLAQKALNLQAEGKISTALSVYNVVQDFNAYNDASSETQRYSAASHGVADGLMAAFPAVGAIAQLVVLSEDLSAAYVTKDYAMEFAKIRAEIIHLQKLKTDMMESEYKAEKDTFSNLVSKTQAANELAKIEYQKITAECSDADKLLTADQTLACFNQYQLYIQILRAQKYFLNAMLTFQGRFMDIPAYLCSKAATNSYKIYSDSLNSMDTAILNAQVSINSITQILSDMQMRGIQSQLQKNRLAMACEGKLLITLSNLIKNKKSLVAGTDEWASDNIDDALADLDGLLTITCATVLEKIAPEVLSLARKFQQQPTQ